MRFLCLELMLFADSQMAVLLLLEPPRSGHCKSRTCTNTSHVAGETRPAPELTSGGVHCRRLRQLIKHTAGAIAYTEPFFEPFDIVRHVVAASLKATTRTRALASFEEAVCAGAWLVAVSRKAQGNFSEGLRQLFCYRQV